MEQELVLKPGSTRTKIDYFIDNKLIQTFQSYEHTAQVFKIHFKDDTIKEYTIRSIINIVFEKKENNIQFFRRIHVKKENEEILIFKNNLEFMEHFKICSTANTSRIINNKIKKPDNLKHYKISVINNIPDIRLHKQIIDEQTIFKICVF